MVDLTSFDANEHQPLDGFEPVPTGEYTAVVTSSEMKNTKAGDGEYLELTWQIVNGAHEGRYFWQRITLVHPSEKAVGFGHRMLSSVCRAVGKLQPQDSTELHNIPCRVRLHVKKGTDGYEDSNEVSRIEPIEAGSETPF